MAFVETALLKTQIATNFLTSKEWEEFGCCESIIERGLATFIEVGNALAIIRNKRLYREGYRTFEEYCRERWGLARNYANKLIASTEVIENLGTIVPKLEAGSTNNHFPLPINEAQARPLTHLEPEQQREAWREAVETAPDGKLTAAHIEKVVARIRPHISHNTGDNEWYTPKEIIETARAVMGEIELDPASTAEANTVIRAQRYYTPEDDGLAQGWRGKTWMNPPYAQPLIEQFASKLVHHVQIGDIPEAIVLVNNATETMWFIGLISIANAVCFSQGRIKFWSPDGRIAAPLQGQAIIYIGDNTDRFLREFKRFGWIARIVSPRN